MKKTKLYLLFVSLASFLALLIPSAGTNGNGRMHPNGDNGAGGWGKKLGMDNERLKKLIERLATIVEGELGFWRVRYKERELFIITDENHNRMRIMTPITEEEKLTEHHLRLVLLANFDRALDAKYALASDYLWSTFTHPLAELTDDQFIDAFKQVNRLADTYGGSYSSTDLIFGGG